MTRTCPAMPDLGALPFSHDRAKAWQAIRDAGPVAISEKGVYFLTSADVVEAAAKNAQLFSSSGAFAILGSPIPLVPIAFDPPEHTRYRHILDRFFSPRSMAAREAQLREQLGALIDEIVASGDQCDVMQALAIPFPSLVFLSLFGLPLEDRDKFIGWKDAILSVADAESPEPSPEVLAKAGELFMYLSGYLAERRGDDQGDDLLSQLVANRDEGGMNDQEILGLCFLFIIAGLDTVTAAAGFAINALAVDPDLRARVVDNPQALTEFLEELLRLDGPVPYVPRMTTEDVDVDGVHIPQGSLCWLAIGAANRDPDRFESADSIGDRRTSHFGFGRGPHRCLGSHLARLELRLIIEEWHKRIPSYELVSRPQVTWPAGTLAYERLDVKFG